MNYEETVASVMEKYHLGKDLARLAVKAKGGGERNLLSFAKSEYDSETAGNIRKYFEDRRKGAEK